MSNGQEGGGGGVPPGIPTLTPRQFVRTDLPPVGAPTTVTRPAAMPQALQETEVDLQAMMVPQAAPPGRSATPTPEPTAMTQAAKGGKTTDRLEAIEDTVREIKDVLGGLKEQVAALSDRLDVAGRKDDDRDGEIVGLKAGLKDAEDCIKRVETAVDTAQKTADVACKRLVEEFGEV